MAGSTPRSQVTARVPADLRESLRRASEQSAVPQQEIIIQALDSYLSSGQPVKPHPTVAMEGGRLILQLTPTGRLEFSGGRIEIFGDPQDVPIVAGEAADHARE